MKNATSRKANKLLPQPSKTVDVQHIQFMTNTSNAEVEMRKIQAEILKISSQITDGKSVKTDENMDLIVSLVDRRLDLTSKLDELKKKNDVMAYYTSTADVLYKYYDLVEKGDTVEKVESQHSILDYFQKKSAPVEKDGDRASDKGCLQEKYMSSTVDAYIKVKNDDRCKNCVICKSEDMVMMTHDGYSYCNTCSSLEFVVVDHDKPSYKDPPKEISYFAYKRINHLNECINQVQGKETTQIPDDIFDRILVEVKKQKITNMADLTYSNVKRILKSLNMSRYYEHIQYIITSLNGLSVPQLSPELEERLRNMFKQIQAPFLKHSPNTRKNFLSYSYCLHKLVQLLDQDCFLHSFPLLRSREKLHQQDMIWKLICKDVGWQFYPSL